MNTHLYATTLQAYEDLLRTKEVDHSGLYLTTLPGGGFTFFLGEEPLTLYTAEPSQQEENV